jgi:hypothetical protein
MDTKNNFSFRTAITPADRVACRKLGAMAALAARGIPPSEFDRALFSGEPTKSAADTAWGLAGKALSPAAWVKGIFVTSMLTGVPAGILWHVAGRRARSVHNDERDLENQIDYYSDASRRLESSLSASKGRG